MMCELGLNRDVMAGKLNFDVRRVLMGCVMMLFLCGLGM